MFKVLEGGGIKATACRTFGLNSGMYADRASDRIGGSEVVCHRSQVVFLLIAIRQVSSPDRPPFLDRLLHRAEIVARAEDGRIADGEKPRLVTRTRIVTVNRYIHTMIGDLFMALCRVPLLKKKLWRAWYNYLARAIRAPDWCFMNYGFADRESSYLQLEPGDEQDRYCIQLYRHVAGAVDLTRRNVLEVGSGRGGGASFVKRYLNPARVTGVDLCESAVDFSMSRHRVEGLHFRVGDAEHLPFDNESFDVVINVESSHCYPRLSSFFFEVRRVLKLGGHFLYADLHDAKTLDEWRACLRGSGLAILAETNITSNVVTALDRDNQRKVTLIQRLVPSLLRPSFQNFAGVRGSQIHEAFQSGPLEYLSFVAQKQI